jgi:hypothetical protein
MSQAENGRGKNQRRRTTAAAELRKNRRPRKALEVGQPIRVGDDKFDLILNILVGIKKSVSSLLELPSLSMINDRQFRVKHKTENEWIANFE